MMSARKRPIFDAEAPFDMVCHPIPLPHVNGVSPLIGRDTVEEQVDGFSGTFLKGFHMQIKVP